jgi:hypothetical protein
VGIANEVPSPESPRAEARGSANWVPIIPGTEKGFNNCEVPGRLLPPRIAPVLATAPDDE